MTIDLTDVDKEILGKHDPGVRWPSCGEDER